MVIYVDKLGTSCGFLHASFMCRPYSRARSAQDENMGIGDKRESKHWGCKHHPGCLTLCQTSPGRAGRPCAPRWSRRRPCGPHCSCPRRQEACHWDTRAMQAWTEWQTWTVRVCMGQEEVRPQSATRWVHATVSEQQFTFGLILRCLLLCRMGAAEVDAWPAWMHSRSSCGAESEGQNDGRIQENHENLSTINRSQSNWKGYG